MRTSALGVFTRTLRVKSDSSRVEERRDLLVAVVDDEADEERRDLLVAVVDDEADEPGPVGEGLEELDAPA